MIRFCANLSTLFTELPFLERFAAAASAGFEAVEFHYPYDHPLLEIHTLLGRYALEQILFNLPPGDLRRGETGLLSDPARRGQFRQDLIAALEIARFFECRLVNVMFGQRLPDLRLEDQVDCALNNLAWAVPHAREAGVTLLLEPLNPLDFPDPALSTTSQAVAILEELNLAEVRLLYDLYHSAMAGEDLPGEISRAFPWIAHVHMADAPGRRQPGTGTLPFREVFSVLEELGYTGAIGLDYTPLGSSRESLAWMSSI